MKLSELSMEHVKKIWIKNEKFQDIVFSEWVEEQYTYIGDILNCFNIKNWEYDISYCSSVHIAFNCKTYKDAEEVFQGFEKAQDAFGLFKDEEIDEINKMFEHEDTYTCGLKRIKRNLIKFFIECLDYQSKNDLFDWTYENIERFDYIYVSDNSELYKPI